MTDKLISKIRQAMASGIMSENFAYFASKPANTQELLAFEKLLPFSLQQYAELLQRTNGINLDMVKFAGIGQTETGIPSLAEIQAYNEDPDLVVIAVSPSGESYALDKDGRIFTIDWDGYPPVEKVADSLEEFICDYMFGKRAGEFMGEEWKREVEAAGLID